MPACLNHLHTAKVFADGYPVSDLPQLYLGCLAPDVPNLDGFASKEERWHAHLRERDLNRWMERAGEFFRENCRTAEVSYLLGYVLHIVGDIVWDESFEQGLREAVGGAGLPKAEQFERRWNEHDLFEQRLLREDWWLREVRPALAAARALPINGLSAEQIGRMQARMVSGYQPQTSFPPAGYLTPERGERFAEMTAEKMKELLWKSGNFPCFSGNLD